MKYGLVIAGAVLLAACTKNIDTEDAVKQGVIKDISSKVDISAMDIVVDSVSFRDKEADAMISFKPKGNTGAGIAMHYSLKREGDEWKIATRSMETKHDQAADGQGDAAPGAAPALPPGHPTVNPPTK